MKVFLICFFLFTGQNLFAKVPPSNAKVLEILKLYKKGLYRDSIAKLNQLEKTKSHRGKALYWKALCYTKIQDYDQANILFQRAIKYKNQPKDIYYEYGQSLYAANELSKARKAFAKSVKLNMRVDESLYYIAYSSQVLEEYPLSIKYYKKLNARKNVETTTYQAANFQLSEVILTQAEKKPNPLPSIKKFVLPQFKKSYEIAENSTIASDIRKRIFEVENKYGLGAPVMITGKKLPKKPYQLSLRQEFIWDSNVTLESTDATEEERQTRKASGIFQTIGTGRYRFDLSRQFTIAPQLRFTLNNHNKDDVPEIYTNDQYIVKSTVFNNFYHFLSGKAAQASLELDYTYTAQDYDQDKNKEFYNRAWFVVLQEKTNFFGIGDTSVRLKYKDTDSYTETQDFENISLAIGQFLTLNQDHSFLVTGTINNKTAAIKTNDTLTYDLRTDWFGPKIWWGLQPGADLTFTFLDTKEQSNTRGTEMTITPRLTLSKRVAKIWRAELEYVYTNKSSDDKENYDYSKNEFALNIEVRI